MTAVDTNVLMRLLVRDDPSQTARATAATREDTIWIPKTVLLETDWVLRRGHGYDRERIAETFGRLAGADRVHVEDESTVARALDLMALQVDFADALHVASSSQATRFVTFDEQLVKRSQRFGSRGTVQVVKL